MSASIESCALCRFFRKDDYNNAVCQRFPPKAEVVDGEYISAWPLVEATSWCGEFRADNPPHGPVQKTVPAHESIPVNTCVDGGLGDLS